MLCRSGRHTRNTVERGHQHSAGHGSIRLKFRLLCPFHIAVAHHEVDCLVIPLTSVNVGQQLGRAVARIRRNRIGVGITAASTTIDHIAVGKASGSNGFHCRVIMGVGTHRIKRNGAWLASHGKAACGIVQISTVAFQIEAVVAAFRYPLTVGSFAGQVQNAVLTAQIALIGGKSVICTIGFHSEQSRFCRLYADTDRIVYGGCSGGQTPCPRVHRKRRLRRFIVYHDRFTVGGRSSQRGRCHGIHRQLGGLCLRRSKRCGGVTD